MWERLVTILSDMLGLYQTLLALSKQKHDVLVAAKAHELEAVTKQEEMLIIQIGKLEVMRAAVLQEIATAYNLTTEDLTLSQLCEVNAPDKEACTCLNELRQQFDKVTAELVQVNKLNTKLIEQALSFVNFNMNLLTQNAAGPTYAPQGQQAHAAPARTVLDRKV